MELVVVFVAVEVGCLHVKVHRSEYVTRYVLLVYISVYKRLIVYMCVIGR